jgi:hypothetical protein
MSGTALARKAPAKQHPNTGSRACSAWTQATTGGMAQFRSIFPGDMAVALTSVASSSDTVPFAVTLSLLPETSVAALQDNGTGIAVYADSLWFQGDLPEWSAWPAADQYAALRPTAGDGAFFDAITVQLAQCSNVRATAYGDNCTATAPPPAAAQAAPLPPAAAAAAARRLAQFGEESCEVFLREVRVPTTLALELLPPRGCVTVGGARCAGNWTLRAFPAGCGTEYAAVTAAVPEATWIADLRSGDPPAWCANWTAVLAAADAPLPPPALLSVRSQYDPYAEAAAITGCTYNFGPTTVEYAAFAANLITFGIAIVTITGCCLVAVIARAASLAAAHGEGAPLAGGGGGAGGWGWGGAQGGGSSGGYGSTGWYGGGQGAMYT